MSARINRPDISVFGQFAQIEAARIQLAERTIEGTKEGTKVGLHFRKIELGEISTQDGRKFGVVVGNFSYPARLASHGLPEPRVARVNRDWVVAIEDRFAEKGGLKPIAYATDLAELSSELRDRLVERVVQAPERLVAEVKARNDRERAILEAPIQYDDSAVRNRVKVA